MESMAKFGKVPVTCPVCGKDWDITITGKLLPRRGKPGQASAIIKIARPMRIPPAHRDCVSKVAD